jgi:hypothetical protein
MEKGKEIQEYINDVITLKKEIDKKLGTKASPPYRAP